MYKEIELGDGNKLIFFRDIDFWEDVLSNRIGGVNKIDIVTYNFNFNDKSGKSFYNRLLTLAEKGVNIRLMYDPKPSKDDTFIDDVFARDILCVRIPFNHSKIFWSEKFVFIGSANFSLGSNKNYEAGFISTNNTVIYTIYHEILCNEIWKNPECKILNTPCFVDPLSRVRGALHKISLSIDSIELGKDEKDAMIGIILELISLREVLEKKDMDITLSGLIEDCEELEYLFDYDIDSECSLNEQGNNKAVRSILEKVRKDLLEVEKEIQELYEKYGKYNFISEI